MASKIFKSTGATPCLNRSSSRATASCASTWCPANPPYSIRQGDRDAFASDPRGRNLYSTPPQGHAGYAFWQHIQHSFGPKTGRCAILFSNGVLSRQEEADMRRKLIEADVIESFIGLGPNLFYNSPMEACLVICRTVKPKARKGTILFINSVNEVTRECAQVSSPTTTSSASFKSTSNSKT